MLVGHEICAKVNFTKYTNKNITSSEGVCNPVVYVFFNHTHHCPVLPVGYGRCKETTVVGATGRSPVLRGVCTYPPYNSQQGASRNIS